MKLYQLQTDEQKKHVQELFLEYYLIFAQTEPVSNR